MALEIFDMLIPLTVIAGIGLMSYQYTANKGGFVGGCVFAIIILYSVDIVESWGILISVLGLAALFFSDRVRGEAP